MHRIITIVLLVLVSTTTLHAADLKVGHFDLQRVIAQSDAGKEAREKYLSKFKSYQDDINARTEKLNKLKVNVDSEVKALKENERRSPQLIEHEKEYASLFRDYQRLLGGYQEELKVYDAELTRVVLEKLTPVMADFATSNKYDYLYRLNETFAFATEKRDVTDELVKAFNKAHRK